MASASSALPAAVVVDASQLDDTLVTTAPGTDPMDGVETIESLDGPSDSEWVAIATDVQNNKASAESKASEFLSTAELWMCRTSPSRTNWRP